jgi:DNA-binding NarL/FixJ family response regulator
MDKVSYIATRFYPMNIFLLEDDPVYADFIHKALKVDPSNQIRVFGTGEEFLKAVENKLPDVMILDYKLPGISGIEVYEKIKSRLTDNQKAILLSSLDDGNMVLNFIQRGVRDYVIKDENVIDSLMAILSGNEEDYYFFK